MSHARVLIVHPDSSIASLMTSMLQTLGHRIEVCADDRVAVRMLEHAPADLVLAGADPDDPDALEFLTCLRRKLPRMPVILLFSKVHNERAREAQLRGALAVLRFPLPATALRAAVAQALGEPELTTSRSANGEPAAALPSGHGNSLLSGGDYCGSRLEGIRGAAYTRAIFEDSPSPRLPVTGTHALDTAPPADPDVIIGEDPTFRQAIDLARTIAPTGAPALIVGERGTGKSRIARALHDQGPRPTGPFIEASCANLREGALDIELFGRRNGGYAEPDRPGKVELARGGTLFLDDVSALTPNLQLKLLRLLRDGLTEPVGANAPERADVRVVMGTREDLASLVPDGRFRQDLYYRVGVVTLKLPPLRLRNGDLERLAEHFRNRFARQLGKDVRSFAPESLVTLRAHGWPGNIQELADAVERAVLVCRGPRIEPNHLGVLPREVPANPIGFSAGKPRLQVPPSGRSSSNGILPLKEALEGPERQLILEALEALNWNRQETARVLDINRTTLYKKMKKYGLLFDEPVWAS